MDKDFLESLSYIVGMIVGTIGGILGAIRFFKSIRIERRLYHEPYFKSIWPSLSEKIQWMNDDIEYLKYNFNNSLKWFINKYTSLRNLEGAGDPIHPRNYNLNNIDFTYDPAVKKLYATQLQKIRRIDLLINAYNEDRYYGSVEVYQDFEFYLFQFQTRMRMIFKRQRLGRK